MACPTPPLCDTEPIETFAKDVSVTALATEGNGLGIPAGIAIPGVVERELGVAVSSTGPSPVALLATPVPGSFSEVQLFAVGGRD